MKEMLEIQKEIENIVEKLRGCEETMAQEKAPFDLFGLFLRDEAPEKWDLLVAADWIDKDKSGALRYIVDTVQKRLSKEEMMRLSRVVLINERNQGFEALAKAIGTARDSKIYNSNFFGFQIRYAHLIAWRGKRWRN